MRRLGQTGIANAGGVLMGLSFLTLAVEPVWHFAPLATLGIGLGFFMLHNTLQTEATQMTPEARGTSVALFASMYFIGQTVGVALAAPVMDRYGARPLFVFAAVMLPALAFWFTRRLKLRRVELIRTASAAAARDPLDLGLDDALDHARQVVVEPGLEHRPQHLRTRSSSVRAFCTSTVWASALKAESTAADVVRRHERAVGHGGLRRRLRPRGGSSTARGSSAMRGSGGGASVKITSDWPSMVWKLGVSPAGSAICSVRSSTSSAAAQARPGGASSPPAWHRCRADPSRPAAAAAARPAGGGDGGTGLRGGIAAGRGGGGAAAAAAGLAAGLAVSSSAMMRRMEARISSIDGSCAFAGWFIAEFLQPCSRILLDAG